MAARQRAGRSLTALGSQGKGAKTKIHKRAKEESRRQSQPSKPPTRRAIWGDHRPAINPSSIHPSPESPSAKLPTRGGRLLLLLLLAPPSRPTRRGKMVWNPLLLVLPIPSSSPPVSPSRIESSPAARVLTAGCCFFWCFAESGDGQPQGLPAGGLAADNNDPRPRPAGRQLQAAQEGRQRRWAIPSSAP